MTKTQTTTATIGYIGLGAMGGMLARRLVSVTQLHIWDLNRGAVESLQGSGAVGMADAAELGRRCDIIFLSLPKTADVEQVILGPQGLLQGMRPGTLIVDQTSGTPGETRAIAARLREAGIAMVDAPVSGTTAAAAAGACTVLYSGAADDVARAMPWLPAITPKVLHCGPRVGDAQATKLVNNTINTGCRLATLEIAALGRKCGLSLAAITQALNTGEGRNRPSELMLTALVEGRASTNFALKHMLKDINQSIQMGMQARSPMPIAGIVRGLLQIGCNTLGESAQLEDVVGLVETMSGTRIAGPADSPEPAQASGLLALVDQAVDACNLAVAQEGVAMGVKQGLEIEALVAAVRASSGWSRALDRLGAGAAVLPEGEALERALAVLREVAELGIRQGASILVVNEVRSSLEAAQAV
jgi:3-hydroxyisobutyrate dehydrogenase